MKKLWGLLLIFLSCKGSGQEFHTRALDSLFDSYQQHAFYFDNLQLKKGNQLIYQRSVGYQNLEKKEPLNKESIFLIGSITKTYTATMIMQLAEEGKLRLTDPLARFYPQLPNAKKITVEMLLRHRSGLFNYTNASTFPTDVVNPVSKQELLERFSKLDTIFTPDAKFEYANTNYVLLGFIIEELTKDSYEHQLKTRILDKLDLKDTYYGRPADSSRFARSYTYQEGTWTRSRPEWNTDWAVSAGGIAATVNDISSFFQALFGSKLVSAKSLQQMMILKDGYGLGLVMVPFGNKVFYGHSGGIENYRSLCAYNPQDGILLTQVSNGAYNDNPNEISIQALNAVYGLPITLPDTAVQKTVEVSPDTLTSYEGMYAAPGFPLQIRIFVKDGQLNGQATSQAAFPLAAVSAVKFIFDPSKISIVFFEQDGKKGFHFQQGTVKVDFSR